MAEDTRFTTLFDRHPFLFVDQGKTGTFLPTRKSDNLHFAIAGWHEKEYYGGVRGSRSSHPLDVSFVLLLVHLPEVFKEADLEGVDEEIVDRAEEIAGGMVAVRLDVLIELGAIPFRKRSGGALVPRKFKSLCVEVEGTAGSRRAWVYTKVSGEHPGARPAVLYPL